MTFRPEATSDFTALFEERKALIRHFEGCRHLELWQQEDNPDVFFTYSIWESQQHLDRYRFSELFRDTWARTKALFAAKAEAWSVAQRVVLE